MIVNRVDKKENFTVIDNSYLKNENLSFKAKGILTYFLSLPDDWVVYYDEIISHSKDGIKAFRSGLDELIANKYILRYPVRDKGLIVRYELVINESNTLLGQNLEEDLIKTNKGKAEKESLLNTNKQNTNNTNNLNKYNIIARIEDLWNRQDGVVRLKNLEADVINIINLNTLLRKYDLELIENSILNISKLAIKKGFNISFSYFVKEENFKKYFLKT